MVVATRFAWLTGEGRKRPLFFMAKFEITTPGQDLADISKRVTSQYSAFFASSVPNSSSGALSSATELTSGSSAIGKAVTGTTDTAMASALKLGNAQAIEAARTAKLDQMQSLVDGMLDYQTQTGKKVAAAEILSNTSLQSMFGDTVDLSKTIDLTTIDWASAGLPNPADFGIDPSSLIDLTDVNISAWALPSPKLGKTTDGCWTLDDVLGDLGDMLSGIDLSGFDLPSFDFSGSAFDDFEWPEWMNRAGVWLGDAYDVTAVNLAKVFDFSNVDWPDLGLDFGGGSDFFDFSGTFDSIKGFFSDMSLDGDIIGLGGLGSILNQIGCAGTALCDALVPDAVIDALANFKMPDIDLTGGAKEIIEGGVINATALLSDDWMWYDKSRGLYNYDNLSRVSDAVVDIFANNTTYLNLSELARSIKMHKKLMGS